MAPTGAFERPLVKLAFAVDERASKFAIWIRRLAIDDDGFVDLTNQSAANNSFFMC
jgi:hypothetical protein